MFHRSDQRIQIIERNPLFLWENLQIARSFWYNSTCLSVDTPGKKDISTARMNTQHVLTPMWTLHVGHIAGELTSHDAWWTLELNKTVSTANPLEMLATVQRHSRVLPQCGPPQIETRAFNCSMQLPKMWFRLKCDSPTWAVPPRRVLLAGKAKTKRLLGGSWVRTSRLISTPNKVITTVTPTYKSTYRYPWTSPSKPRGTLRDVTSMGGYQQPRMTWWFLVSWVNGDKGGGGYSNPWTASIRGNIPRYKPYYKSVG